MKQAPPVPGRVDVASIGEDLPLLEGIRTTLSIRRLRPEPVPPGLLRKVCEAGTFAPSGGNRQPWTFVAVTEPERRAWVAERYRAAFDDYIAPARKAAEAPDFPAARRRNIESAAGVSDHLHEVPVHLFVAGRLRRGDPQFQSVFPAIQNVLLACRAVGLGACLTMLHLAHGRQIDDYLGLAEDNPSCALIAVGWPAVAYRRPVRKPVDEVLHFERYRAADEKDAKKKI